MPKSWSWFVACMAVVVALLVCCPPRSAIQADRPVPAPSNRAAAADDPESSSRDLAPTRDAVAGGGITVLDRGGRAIAGARLWPVDAPPVVLPDVPALAVCTDDGGRAEADPAWLGRRVVCFADGFLPALEAWPEAVERNLVLDRAPVVEVEATIDGRPLESCEVVFARARIGNAGAKAVTVRWGGGPVIGMAGEAAVWRATTDAAGRCTVRGLPEGTYCVAAFHSRAYPLDERYLGAEPFFVGAGFRRIECEPFLAAAAIVPTASRVVARWASVPRGAPSDRAGAIARRAFAARRMEVELGATMVRLLAPADRGLAGRIEADFRVLCADGSLWFGAIPMIDARELDGPAFLQQVDVPAASVRVRLRRGAHGTYDGPVHLLHGPALGVPPLPVRDGDVVRLPLGAYRWEFAAPNPWLPRQFDGGAFELTGAVDVICALRANLMAEDLTCAVLQWLFPSRCAMQIAKGSLANRWPVTSTDNDSPWMQSTTN
ncbi:MAG: hypothetical protein KF830_12860 [Planctomycetes bacterium]|nr:hypothetical protein [Planctomycetota bacterium]